MSRKFLTAIDLNTNELQNAVIQGLSSDPTGIAGRIYYNTGGDLKFYNGTAWKTISTGAGSFTLGTTTINLGSTTGTIEGMTSITSTDFVGALTGNASTATKLATARAINGVNFDGSAAITITANTTNSLTIGTGLSGSSFNGSSAVTIALSTAGTAGTYTKVTTDAYGRVTSGTTLTSSDIPDISGTYLTSSTAASTYLTQTNAASTYAPKSSPTFTGTVTVPDPENPTDAANKRYVDDKVAGLTWKASVNLLADSDVALTGTSGTLVIDGHTALSSTHDGYRILLTNQTTGSEEGIYVYSDAGSGYTLARAADADTYQELLGATVFVSEGTLYGNTSWVQSNHYITSFTGQDWVQFNGAQTYSAGDGLTIDGNEFNVVGTTDRITVGADSVDIASTYAGQSSITTLGTIATGTWSATEIAVANGGTGATTAGEARTNLSSTSFALPQKYAADCGSLTSSGGVVTFTVTHNLGTTDVTVSLKDTATKALVEADVVITDTNTVTISWNSASTVTSGAYRAVVIG